MPNKLEYNKAQLIELWDCFSDVAIDDEDRIMMPFMGFEAGENRFEVWKWFDERYPGGVHTLIEDYAK